MKEENEVETKKEVEELGLYKIKEVFEKEIIESNTKFYYGSLRSGQRIEFTGSLIIIGDVNAGAEVFASENISIVGALRGMAHAGATGNTKATISAMGIYSAQIRIANIVKELETEAETIPVRKIAKVEEKEIKIQ